MKCFIIFVGTIIISAFLMMIESNFFLLFSYELDSATILSGITLILAMQSVILYHNWKR